MCDPLDAAWLWKTGAVMPANAINIKTVVVTTERILKAAIMTTRATSA